MLKVPTYLDGVLEHGGTVVVPSRQRAHALRLAYDAAQLAQGRQVWNSPDVLPLEGWLAREIERHAARGVAAEGAEAGRPIPRLLCPGEEWLLWRQCTEAATVALDLVHSASLAQSLRRASALAADLDIALPAPHAAAAAETELLALVHAAVAQRCLTLGAAAASSISARLPCIGEERMVVFAGFAAPTPRLRSIIAARARRGCQSRYVCIEGEGPRATPRFVASADEREELEQIAQWCRACLSEQPDARLLILMPGSAGRRERLATLIRQAVEPGRALASADGPETPPLVGLEGGRPLASLPLVAHALDSLALLSGQPADIERQLEWLRAPWWDEPGAPDRARLDLWLRERAGLRLDLGSLLALLGRAPAPLAAPAQALRARLQQAARHLEAASGTPREWSERLGAALAVLGWPGARTRGSGEQQTLLRFHELLDELGQLSAAAGGVTLDVAVEWLTALASHTPYRPADDDPAITIASAYADPVVCYDGVWVAGLHAEALPQPAAPDPFLPLAAQVAAGYPAASAAGRLAEARALLAAWRAAATELVLSSPARAADIELLPSPLIEEWRGAPDQPFAPVAPVWLPARLHRPGLLRDWQDEIGLPWTSQQPLPSGTRSLELQNQCPFRAYAELRLGSAQLGIPEPGVAPDARGQLLHAALQRLWERLGDSDALAGLSALELDERVGACLEAAAAALDTGQEPIAAPALVRECRRTARLIRKLLEIERRRAPFRVRHTEYESRLRIAGQELRLRIDRLDALADGGLAILDYKSGRRASADWYGERPSHPQLLAYLAAVGDDVVAMATVNVTAREVRFDGIAARERLLPKVAGVKAPPGESADPWRLRVAQWRALVERLAVGFAAGQAAVDPKPLACDYCHIAGVCRVGDGLIGVQQEERVEDSAGGADDE